MKRFIFLSVFFMIFMFSQRCFCENYIVSLKESKADEVMEDMTSSGAAISLLSEDSFEGEVISEKLNMILTSEEDAKALLEEGKAEFIEPDYEIFLLDTTYNDPYFSYQSYYDTDNISALKDVSNRGKGVRVGVLDSGVYRDHTDFSGADIETGYNFVADSTDTSDIDNHGTSVISIIAAQDNNGTGIAGIAPEATIVPIVVYQDEEGTLSTVINGLMAAADTYSCDILNMSIGITAGESSIRSLKQVFDYVESKGIIVVAAVGNKGNDIIYYPAGYDSVIGVGAVDSSKTVASFSERNETVYVTAQGKSVYALNYSGGVSSVSGTSFSAPVTTAMLTLLLSIDDTITPEQMREIVKKAAVDLGDTGYDTNYGYGLMDGAELYRAYLDTNTVFASEMQTLGSSHTFKFYSDSVDSFYVHYSVFNNGIYQYGEYKKITLSDNVQSDVFEYTLSNNDEIKAIIFSDFDTLVPYSN